ncbi:MAG: SusC/RagA family TonB-linked outer membrane protein [Bacteroidota bacterium]
MKKLLLFLALFSLMGIQIYAQNTITGTVTGADGDPVIGATITAKGHAGIGTITKLDGTYSLDVPSGVTTLIFSFVGMQNQEVEIGGRTTISVTLQNDDIGIDEIVITALGLEADRDKLSGTITTVSSESIKNTGESGIIQSLSGKTSGLNIVQSTGDPGAGAYIQIRGQSTITKSIQPLIIIDGVPAINSSSGDSHVVSQQSRLNDINSNDIERIEVLKGASAAAVWGTRAANGVIIITTKSGKGKNKGISVNFKSGFYFDQIGTEYKKQNVFGQGRDGFFETNVGESWGDKISERAGGLDEFAKTGQFFLAENGNKYYPINVKNSTEVFDDANREQVFRNGFSSDIHLGVNLKSDKSNTYISFGNWDQKGVLNGQSDYKKSNIRVNYTLNPTNKLRFKLNTFYSNISSNRIQQGSNTSGLYLAYLRTPADFDNTDYKGTYYDNDGIPHRNAHRSYRRYLGDRPPVYANPGWVLNEMINTSQVNRIMLSPEVQYDIIKRDKLSSRLTMRFGNDIAIDNKNTFYPVNTRSSRPDGRYIESWRFESQHLFQAFNRTVHNLGNYNLSWIIGGQYEIRNIQTHSGTMTSFINVEDQILDYANATNENKYPSTYEWHKYKMAGYLVVNLDIYDQVFLEFTGRSEKSNAFSNIIFYPSASVAWQFTKTLVPENAILSFGKLRASYGTVGVEPALYNGGTDYISVSVDTRWSDLLDADNYGGGLRRSRRQGNSDLVPERKTEIELGTDLRLLKDYLTINATYYQNRIEGAIFAVDVPASTGYSSIYGNAGSLSNQGVEVDVTGNILKKGDFRWDVLLNFSQNKNLVEDLKGVESIYLAGHTNASSRAVEGYALGTLWGGRFETDEAGSLVLDDNGFPSNATEHGILGDPNPDYRAGLGTTLSYKGFSANVLFETSQGQDMWAGTYGVLNHFGVSPNTANEITLENDVVNYLGNTIPAGTTVRGNLQDFGGGEVLLDEEWYTSLGGGFGPAQGQFVYDASFIRLREVSVTYDFPRALLQKIKLSNASLSLIGRNLLLWSEFADNYGVDPQTNLYGTSNGRGLDYFTNPSTRSYGFKLSVGF